MKPSAPLWLVGWMLCETAFPAFAIPTLEQPLSVGFVETDVTYVGYIYISISEPAPSGGSQVSWMINAPPGSFGISSGTVVFNPGSRDSGIGILVEGDDIPEALATFSITFSDPVNLNLPAGGPAFHMGILTDDDHRTVSITGGAVAEGNAGTAQLQFTISINEAMTEDFTFNYATSGGTAVAGEDYIARTGSAKIPGGATSTVLQVIVIGDVEIETDETVGLTLSGFSVPGNPGTVTPGTILNDDFGAGPVPLTTLVTEASGGSTAQAWIAVDLPAPRSVPSSCRVSTRDGTAAGSDYNALPATDITFAPGETRKWVAITITSSLEEEAQEQFFLDVEALDSHEIKSAPCIIERLAVTEFRRHSAGIYAVRFPTGVGQRYVIEEAGMLAGPWIPAGSLLTGTGFPVTQFLLSENARGFFRVRTATPLPPGPPAAES